MAVVIVTGSEGLLGTEISKFLEKENEIVRADLRLGDDLCDEQYVQSWFARKRGDYLVNCFGLNDHVSPDHRQSNLFDVSLGSFDEYLRVNLTALFSVCREFARNNRGGGIVNFSATTGVVSARPDLYGGDQKHIGYCVSKAGVVQLTKHLAVHLAPRFRVNCLVPGGAQSNQSEEFQKRYSTHTPLGRMMEPTELNGIIRLLCSEQSSYMTGAVIVVDGGWTIW